MTNSKQKNLYEIYNIRQIISYMCDTQRPVNPEQQNDPNIKTDIQDAFIYIFRDIKYENLKFALIDWSSRSDRFPYPKDIFNILRNMGGDNE